MQYRRLDLLNLTFQVEGLGHWGQWPMIECQNINFYYYSLISDLQTMLWTTLCLSAMLLQLEKAYIVANKDLREKCPYSELFWSVFSVLFPENTYQNNSVYGHFLRSKGLLPFRACLQTVGTSLLGVNCKLGIGRDNADQGSYYKSVLSEFP